LRQDAAERAGLQIGGVTRSRQTPAIAPRIGMPAALRRPDLPSARDHEPFQAAPADFMLE
jgi:hypothetical protein